MEEGESRAPRFFQETEPRHWFRHMDDNWVKIKNPGSESLHRTHQQQHHQTIVSEDIRDILHRLSQTVQGTEKRTEALALKYTGKELGLGDFGTIHKFNQTLFLQIFLGLNVHKKPPTPASHCYIHLKHTGPTLL